MITVQWDGCSFVGVMYVEDQSGRRKSEAGGGGKPVCAAHVPAPRRSAVWQPQRFHHNADNMLAVSLAVKIMPLDLVDH